MIMKTTLEFKADMAISAWSAKLGYTCYTLRRIRDVFFEINLKACNGVML